VFIERYIDKCNYMSFIIRQGFCGKGLDKFLKKMLERTDIVCITQFDDASKIFGSSVDKRGYEN
jgi:hypothetical protein